LIEIGQLFLAALIPGIILVLFFCGYMVVVGLRDKNIQRDKRASLSEIWQATRESIGGLIVILTLSLRELTACILKAGKLSSMIILIIVAANITGNLVTMSEITQDLLALIKSMSFPPGSTSVVS